jgi:hypothetical protein
VSSDLSSPFWQNAILYLAGLFLVWEIFGGWRRGVIRAGLHFGAFVASGFLGLLAGKTTASICGVVLPGFSFFAGLLAGSVVTLLVLGTCLFLSTIVFKRTYQQPPGLVRWLFGVGGAFFGILTGLFILWGTISILRAAGAISQATTQSSAVSRSLIALKESLENGPLGGVVKSIDILPTETYDRMAQLGELSKDSDAMMRFLDDPGVQKLLTHPRIQALMDDRELIQAAETKNFLVILQNRSVMKAITDPSVQKLVTEVDFEKALDRAGATKQNPEPSKKKP